MSLHLRTKILETVRKFGLIGKRLGHSFSANFFREKFDKEGIADADYQLFELEDLSLLPVLLQSNPNIKGLNVTIPYKQAVIPYLSALEDSAVRIGAVNTIKFTSEGAIGYNTDMYGFRQSLENWFAALQLSDSTKQELAIYILGTGGAAMAVAEALRQLYLPFSFVSHTKTQENILDYSSFATRLSADRPILLVNTTPLGMYPNIANAPSVPFDQISTNILVYDLIYNPVKTLLLEQAEAKGCPIKNGIEMLHLQAEMAWQIWNT